MIALLRLSIFGFIALTVLYVCVSIYSRSVRREKLEKRWDAAPGEGGPEARDAYIEKGMAEYQGGLRRKLIVLVYVVPITVVLVLLYLTNFY